MGFYLRLLASSPDERQTKNEILILNDSINYKTQAESQEKNLRQQMITRPSSTKCSKE